MGDDAATVARAAQVKGVQKIDTTRAFDHIKAKKREEEEQQKWLNQSIDIRMLDPKGLELDGCSWKIPRKKMTREHLQEKLDYLTSPKDVKIDCIRDEKTNEVIWPENMMKECVVKRNYIIVARWPDYPIDQSKDPNYFGDFGVALYDVAMWTDDWRHDVRAEDVREWLICAILEEDKKGKLMEEVMEQQKRDMAVIMKEMALVPKKNLWYMTDEQAIKERQRLFEFYEEQRGVQGEKIEFTRKRIKYHRNIMTHIKLEMTQVDKDENRGVCTWHIRFMDEKEGERVMNELLGKFDLAGIKLAVGCKENGYVPWAGRGVYPDGTEKWHHCDYTEYAANSRSIRLSRLRHGVGIWMDAGKPREKTDMNFYHGMFAGGKYHGYGTQFSDGGIYAGEYNHGLKEGKGRLLYADGDAVSGQFKSELRRKQSRLRLNKFRLGQAWGKSNRVEFSDGSVYEGEMTDGVITGYGTYTSAVGLVIQGNFKDGLLHGKGSRSTNDGEKFDGKWRQGLLHGMGSWDKVEGGKYFGSFRNGKKEGYGIETYNNAIFRGYYLSGSRGGLGNMQWEKRVGFGSPANSPMNSPMNSPINSPSGSPINSARSQGADDIDLHDKFGKKDKMWDYSMECQWIAGYMRQGGSCFRRSTNQRFYTFNRTSPRYPYISELKLNEEREGRYRDINRRKSSYLEQFVKSAVEAEVTECYHWARAYVMFMIENEIRQEYSRRKKLALAEKGEDYDSDDDTMYDEEGNALPFPKKGCDDDDEDYISTERATAHDQAVKKQRLDAHDSDTESKLVLRRLSLELENFALNHGNYQNLYERRICDLILLAFETVEERLMYARSKGGIADLIRAGQKKMDKETSFI